MPVIGKGDTVWALLHLDDAAAAFVAATAAPQSGVWHMVDDHGVCVRDFLNYFARRLGVPRPLQVPVWLARLVVGTYSVNFFTISTRTTNTRFRRDFGWRPRFPSFREGIHQIINQWAAEG